MSTIILEGCIFVKDSSVYRPELLVMFPETFRKGKILEVSRTTDGRNLDTEYGFSGIVGVEVYLNFGDMNGMWSSGSTWTHSGEIHLRNLGYPVRSRERRRAYELRDYEAWRCDHLMAFPEGKNVPYILGEGIVTIKSR